MKKSFIDTLIENQDRAQMELMADFDIQRILETVCAFLNTQGGWVVVGRDRERTGGLGDRAAIIADEIETAILNRIFPQPMVYTNSLESEGRAFVLVNVVKGARAPYALDHVYYVRAGNETRIPDNDEISLLIRSSKGHASLWEKSDAIDAEPEDLIEKEIITTIQEANRLGKGEVLPNTTDGFLSYFQLQDFDRIKNGAVLLFGVQPIRFLPQARIRITVMVQEKTAERYQDTTLIETNLFEAFQQVQTYFKRNLPMVSEFSSKNWDRISVERYPLEALDEAIINAMVHRDYGDVGGEITINIFSDRMEIINSGEIPGNIVTRKNQIGPHHSILRNPTIAHMFYLRGKMEKLGRGLDLILHRFAQAGLKKPEWTFNSGYTTLTLFSTEEDVQFNERMITFMTEKKPGDIFSSKDYQVFFEGLSDRVARTDISRLVAGGWLDKIGDGPSTRYERTRNKLPDISG